MQIQYQWADTVITLQVEKEGEGVFVRLSDGTVKPLTARRLPDGMLLVQSMEPGAKPVAVALARTERGVEIASAGETFVFTPVSAGGRSAGKRGKSSGTLTAPMVGVVAEVLVQEGETVTAYQPLAVVEAMKVMATLEAPFAGIVQKVLVGKGQRVKHGETLLELIPLTGDAD